jgi:hypothetical protein
MDKIICNKCNHFINIDDDFLISINSFISGINYENINSILPRFKCSECGSKDISITHFSEQPEVKTIENIEDIKMNEPNIISTNNKWDYGVDENDKIIPFSTQQQHSGKTSIDNYRKDYRKY